MVEITCIQVFLLMRECSRGSQMFCTVQYVCSVSQYHCCIRTYWPFLVWQCNCDNTHLQLLCNLHPFPSPPSPPLPLLPSVSSLPSLSSPPSPTSLSSPPSPPFPSLSSPLLPSPLPSPPSPPLPSLPSPPSPPLPLLLSPSPSPLPSLPPSPDPEGSPCSEDSESSPQNDSPTLLKPDHGTRPLLTASQPQMSREIASLTQGGQSTTYPGRYMGQSDPTASHYDDMYSGECESGG